MMAVLVLTTKFGPSDLKILETTARATPWNICNTALRLPPPTIYFSMVMRVPGEMVKTLWSTKVIWALERDLVRITSPGSTPSLCLTGVAGNWPFFKRSTLPSTWVMRPTTAAGVPDGSNRLRANHSRMAESVLVLIFPPPYSGRV